jgi:hypothetical protein
MRTILLIPFAFLAGVAVGCGPAPREQVTGSIPKRDLTLVTQAPALEIASQVETQRLHPERRAARAGRLNARLASASRSAEAVPVLQLVTYHAPAPLRTAPEPVAQPASTAPSPADDRELLPGKTVTVIPASSGPSVTVDHSGDIPARTGHTLVGHGGGSCGGRGRGPGGNPAPHPDFR